MDKAARELMKIARSLQGADLPVGYFVVTGDFRLSFGAWRMSFRKGQVLKSKRDHLYRWDVKRNDWYELAPPISGRSNFSLSQYGKPYEQEGALATFEKNTKKISEQEATRLTISMERRIEVRVRDIPKVIEQMGLRGRDEVVLIVPSQS